MAQKFVAELYKGTKPGGVLAVVDHYAAPGSPRESGNTLHRIDPEIVVEEIEAAGFVLEARERHTPESGRRSQPADG